MITQALPSLAMSAFALLQALLLLAVTPLLTGVSRQIRARMHSRHGPGIWQDYRDLFKLLKRQSVAPQQSGPLFRLMPYLLLGAMLLVAMVLPLVTETSPFAAAGDLIALLYLFALFRFFFALSGLDSGSPFAGIGASREMSMGILVEPTLILAMLVVALIAGSTNVGMISATLAQGWSAPTAIFLALLAAAFATFIEMGKIPFDVAEAEQELQEGPLTEYSGSGLGLVKWGLGLKQVVVAQLFLALFIPYGKLETLTLSGMAWALPVALIKLLLLFTLASLVENSMARGRFLQMPHVTWLGFGLAVLAFVLSLTGM